MKNSKILLVFMTLLVSFGLVFGNVKPIVVNAYESALMMDEYTVVLGSKWYDGNPYWFDLTYVKNQEIMFNNIGGSYTSSSDNNNIVKTSVSGDKVNLVGVSAGTTKIRLYRNGYEVGNAIIHVNTPSVKLWGSDSLNYGLGLQGSNISITDRNLSATYEFVVDKEGFKVYDDILPTGQILTKVDATKVGQYNLEVFEKLNGSRRSMGKYVCNVFDTIVNKEFEIELGANNHASEVFLKYGDRNYDYYFESNVDLYARNPYSFESWVGEHKMVTGKDLPISKYNIYISSGQVLARQLGTQKVKVYYVPRGSLVNGTIDEMVAYAKDNKIKYLGETTVKVVPAKPRTN